MLDYLDHAMRDAGRIELRHQAGDRWLSGLFDDIGALRTEIRSRSDEGNLYTTINAPRLMPVSNSMHARALGDADIAFHVRLPFDLDPVRPVGMPSTDSEMHAALKARDRLVATLLGCGWPRPATAASGNGGHALYRIRMPVSPESASMLAVLYAGMKMDFSADGVDFDTTVRNPGRIWRLYGTTNRKGASTATRPHRTASVVIPARWEAVSPRQVEALASMYARRPLARQQHPPHPHPQQQRGRPVDGTGNYATLDAPAWFAAHAHYRRHLEGDKHAVRCPWDSEHSSDDGEGSTATVVWEARGRCWPNFCCRHAHCEGRGIRDVLALWSDADDFCNKTWGATT